MGKYLKTNLGIPSYIDLPHPMTAREIGSHLINKLNLNGCRIEGNPNTKCQKLMIPQHTLGVPRIISSLLTNKE